MKIGNRLLAMLLLLCMLATSLPLTSFADSTAEANAGEAKSTVDRMVAIEADTELAAYKQGSTFTVANDGYIGIPVEVSVYYDSSTVARPGYALDATPVIIYVVNAIFDRIGTDSDTDIIKSMVKRGYAVLVCDYLNNEKAVSPALDWSAQALRNTLRAGTYFTDKNVFPAGTYYNSFVVPSGYDVSVNNVFWEIDKHSTAGTLEKIVEMWNNDFRGCKAETVIKWVDGNGVRKPTQNGHDGSAPVWYDDAAGAVVDENGDGKYIKIKHTLAVNVTDCVKADGSPIDLNIYMNLIYPTGGVEVPVLALAGSAEHLANGSATANRPHLVGAVFNGYAGVMYDHLYAPMARDDHYGYFGGDIAGGVTGDNNTYSLQFYNNIEVNTAAMRYIRYLSLSDSRFNFKLDGIGTYGNSKGGWMAFLGEEDPYSTSPRRIYSGHHGETRYENGETVTNGIIDGGEPQPWLTYDGKVIDCRSNFIYCSCGGTEDAITAGHSPTFITCNANDPSCYGSSQLFVDICRGADVPTMWFEIPLGHTLGVGMDTMHGVDVYEAFFKFADYWLKGSAVKVVYIEADMSYGGLPTYAPFTVKFTGSVSENEVKKIKLTAPDGKEVGGYWTALYGRTEWTFHPTALKGDTEYTLTVPKGLCGENGIALAETVTHTVKTGYETTAHGSTVTSVDGSNGTYMYFTLPNAAAVTDFNVNKYSLRFNVTNDAVNQLGVYEVSGFNASSPDSATVGKQVALVKVNGKGYYEIDITDALNGKKTGDVCAFLVKQEKQAASNTIFSYDASTGRPAGFSVSGSVANRVTELDGNGVLELTAIGLGGKENNAFYGSLGQVKMIAAFNIISPSEISASDVGRRFVISFRVYDTVERYINVSLSDPSSQEKGIVDYGGCNVNVKTKKNEWVNVSLVYDVYEPERFGSNGCIRKSLDIKMNGFGTEAPPIYFDDFKTVETVTDVAFADSGAELVLTTTEQRVNPLETKYGVISDVYADEQLYPFALFRKTDTGYEFITALSEIFDDSLVSNYQNINSEIIVYMRRDFVATKRFTEMRKLCKGMFIDLGGHTLTANSTTWTVYILGNKPAHNVTEISFGMANGNVITDAAKAFLLFGSNGAGGDGVNYKVTFDNVKFVSPANSSNAFPVIQFTSATSKYTADIVFNGCTFDMTTANHALRLFNTGSADGNIQADITVNGCELYLPNTQSLALVYPNNQNSTVTFDKYDGKYFKIKLPTGVAGPSKGVNTVNDGTLPFVLDETADGYDYYTLPDINTPYGKVGNTYASAAAYPFALFKKQNNGYEFLTAVDDIFNEANVTQYRDIDAEIIVYMRRNVTSSYTFTKLKELKVGMTIDLGGHTLTSGAGWNVIVQGDPTRHAVNSLSLAIKNGTVLTHASKTFVLFRGVTAGADGMVYNVTFDNVTFVNPKGGVNAYPVIQSTTSASTFSANVIFNNCVFDMSDHAATLRLFALGHGTTLTGTITVNGGTIYLPSNHNYVIKYINTGSSLTFGKYEGEYYKIVLPTGTTAPNYTGTTVNDENLPFMYKETVNNNDVYTIPTVNTPYGKVTNTYASENDYPFALFIKKDNGYEFVTAVADIFNESNVSLYRDIDAEIIVYMRRDFTANSIFTKLRELKVGMLIDLGGHTLTSGSGWNMLIQGDTTRHNVTRLSFTMKNGTVITNSAKTFLLFRGLAAGADGMQYDVNFDGVTFINPTVPGNSYPVIQFTNSVSKFTTAITFNGCTFDMTKSTGILRLFNAGNTDGNIVADITVNGGKLCMTNASKLALTYFNNKNSTVTFTKGTDGYFRIALLEGGAPAAAFDTKTEGKAFFEQSEVVGEFVLTPCAHSYDNVCDADCNDCGTVRDAIAHLYDIWGHNTAQHWKKCSVCGKTEANTYAEHIYDDDADTECVCGYKSFTIKIDYVDGNGNAVADSVTKRFEIGSEKSVLSPAVDGYYTRDIYLKVKADAANKVYTVVYRKIPANLDGDKLDKYISDMVAWGDSITAGAGSSNITSATEHGIDLEALGSTASGGNYVSVLKNLITSRLYGDIAVDGCGVGGEATSTIAARADTKTYYLYFDGAVTIGTGAVTVPLAHYASGGRVGILRQGGTDHVNPVTVKGFDAAGNEISVVGDLSISLTDDAPAGTNKSICDAKYLKYTFTRTDGGTNTLNFVSGARVITKSSYVYDGRTCIIFMGENGGFSDLDELIKQQEEILEACGNPKYFLIISSTSGSNESRKDIREALSARWGANYINMGDELNSSRASYELAGYSNEAINAIQANIDAGTVTSLLIQDSCHPNAVGYAVVGNVIFERLFELGAFEELLDYYDCLNGVKEHSFTVTDNDDTQHWKKCSLCGTSDAESYEDHIFDNNCDTDCGACGYVRKIEHKYNIPVKDGTHHGNECSCGATDTPVAHDYATAKKDETYHWNECSCGATDTPVAHDYATAKKDNTHHWSECSCGATTPKVEHTYNDSKKDETYHWNECSCGATDEKLTHNYTAIDNNDTQHWNKCATCGTVDATSYDNHKYTDDYDNTCDCGYNRGHQHVYDTVDRDDVSHWNKCSCGEIDQDSVLAHDYVDNCDVDCDCGYERVAPHNYKTEYETDDDQHWIICGDCDEEKPDSRADHEYTDNCDVDCACGYERVAPHNYKTTFETDDDQHWIICGDCNEEKPDSRADHEYADVCDVDCDCGYERTAPHNYNTEYETDDDQHWIICGDCDEEKPDSRADHDYDDNCDVDCDCGYERVAPHNYKTEYETDDDQHWIICGDCDEEKPDSRADHEYTDNCDVDCDCGYERVAPHNYKTTFETDDDQHWIICADCDEEKPDSRADHEYADVCDVDCDCGYERVAPHNYKTEYESSVLNHWIICADCGEEKEGTKGAHGGKATCVEAATCPTCGNTYGNIDPDAHAPSGEWVTEDGMHWQICTNGCDTLLKEYHCFGGKATCTEKAVCIICKNAYGDVLDHVYDGDCDTKCNLCNAPVNANSAHVYENSCDTACNVCGAKRSITHTYTNACDAYCDVCYEVRIPEAHTGGTATCTKKAECTVCGTEYSEYADHVFGAEWKNSANYHWYECTCGSKKDEAAHNFSDWSVKDGKRVRTCECGYTISDPAYVKEESVSTGLTVTLIIAGIAVSGAMIFGAIWSVKKKK